MASKRRNDWLDWSVYLAVRCVVCLIQSLPLPIAFGFAKALAVLLYTFDKRHRNVALSNLKYAIPELDDRQRHILVRRCYRHLCLMMVEMVVFTRRLNVLNYPNHIALGLPPDVIGDFLRPEKPLLLVTAHFGNWEVAGYATGLFGFKTYAIARDLDNVYLDRFLKKFRQKTGQTILAKKGDFDRITEILGSGGKVATLGDQDAGQKGLFIPFFNRPASTHKAVALMAMEFNARMVVLGVPRIREPMGFAIEVEDVIDPAEYAQLPDGVRRMTERYTAALERMIRRHPEQYFWLHRRWKHEPPVRGRKAR